MNLINPNIKTMSSREIADLTNKDHKNVVRDIKNMTDQLDLDALSFERTYVDQSNRNQKEYHLDKKLSLCLVSGYSAKLRMAIIDRWEQLENGLDLNNPIQLRSLLLDYAEKNIQLKEQVQVLEPKAKGLDRIASCDGNLGIREAAKVLKINQKTLVQYLTDYKVIYRDQSQKIQGYQKSVDQKLIHISVSGPRQTTAGEKVFSQVKLTQKLITRIAAWLEKEVH